MSDAFELEICQGKYRYRYEAGKQEVWRNGEPWEVMNGRLIGDKFVFSLAVELDEALKERDALRAKIETMEKQEPVAWLHETRRDSDVVTSAVKHVWQRARPMSLAAYSIPLYLAPGAKGEEK